MDSLNSVANLSRSRCCGCGACALICPKGAVSMVPMDLGHLYPSVDPELCVDCGLCLSYCIASHGGTESTGQPLLAYAAASKEDAVLSRSSSGGVSASLAKRFVSSGGVVFGCSMELDQNLLQPKHIAAETQDALRKLQGSKYVQSALGDSFPKVRQMLQQGRTVLFIGTPCQVDALKRFLGNESTDGLFTVDLICHGVPSVKFFQDYLRTLRDGIIAFSFREKSCGWGLTASYLFKQRNRKIRKAILPSNLSSYYSYFLQGEIYRDSCYSCKYASTHRVGDITIGDYWGIEKEHPEFLRSNGGSLDADKGVSTVLVNSEKGFHLLNTWGADVIFLQTSLERIKKWNKQLQEPSICSNARNQIVTLYQTGGYAAVETFFRKSLGLRLLVRKIKFLVKSCIANGQGTSP